MSVLKITTRNFGRVNAKSLSSYVDCGGLKALACAVNNLKPEGVIREIKESALLGRGGAGFPTGKKWELARDTQSAEKFLICNADEGELGAFKDRYLLGSDPWTLLEGLAIAAFAVDARKAYIYLRGEYAYLGITLTNAIRQIEKKIKEFFELDVELFSGAGAYVCGEETALIESLEGRRGDARFRPPYPPVSGLWGKPTVINNVETLMNVPQIILNGSSWFNQIGTEKSKGAKVFSVCGDVQKSGVFEVAMGTPLSELLVLAGARDTKMVLVGGASGRIIPEKELNIPLAYETVLGAGAVIVLDHTRGAVETAYKIMEFFQQESCGKCAPCREGTGVMLEILQRFRQNAGTAKDLRDIEALAETMRLCSLCGLGQTAPNVLMDTLKYFRDEYEVR